MPKTGLITGASTGIGRAAAISANIRVKIVEPGPIKTDFYTRSMAIAHRPGLDVYDALVAAALPKLNQSEQTVSPPEVTAQVIYRAATDGIAASATPQAAMPAFCCCCVNCCPIVDCAA